MREFLIKNFNDEFNILLGLDNLGATYADGTGPRHFLPSVDGDEEQFKGFPYVIKLDTATWKVHWEHV